MDSTETSHVFHRTIVSHIITLFTEAGRPLTLKEIVRELQEKQENLRRVDGGKYSGNIKKAVLGCLQQNEAFEYRESRWVMDAVAADRYVKERMETIEGRKRPDKGGNVRKLSKARHNRLISLLNRKTVEMNTEPRYCPTARGLFRGVTEQDTGETIAKKLGLEKAIGVAQAYQLVRTLYQEIYTETEERSLGTDLEKIVRAITSSCTRIQSSLRSPSL